MCTTYIKNSALSVEYRIIYLFVELSSGADLARDYRRKLPSPPTSTEISPRSPKVDQLFAMTSTPKQRERRVRTKQSEQRAAVAPPDLSTHPRLAHAQADVEGAEYRLKDLTIDTPRHEHVPDTGRSIDTQVLLQDTDHVMKVLGGQRVQQSVTSSSKTAAAAPGFDVFDFNNFKQKEELHLDLSDGDVSDSSSTCALVDEHITSSSSLTAASAAAAPKPGGARRAGRGKRSGLSVDFAGASDGFESEESGSIASNSTDYSHGHSTSSPQVARKASSGDKAGAVGRISNTRTNRAFALRRSRTETEELDTPKSDVTAVATPNSASSSKLSSARDTSRTDVSLGAKIVQKSRANNKVKRDDTFTRKDGGRFSLRAQKSNGSLLGPNKTTPSTTTSDRKGSSDLSRPRAGRQTSLTVKGSSAKPSSSSTSSHHVSGRKSEEHDAWKRRSKYDPRKAIAQAKAKEQERKESRTRSADNTPDISLASSGCGGDDDTEDDSFALGAESINMSGVEDMDEIAKLSSAVASDLDMLTASAQHEQEEEYAAQVGDAFAVIV